MKKKDEALLKAIKTARLAEKSALAQARAQASMWVKTRTEGEHNKVLDAVRNALAAGYSNRQIGLAYGSTDPYTAKRLVSEAGLGSNVQYAVARENHPEWVVEVHDAETFTIRAFALGEQKLSGEGKFRIDEDGENFSQIEGDEFIQIQMYRLGLVEQVLQEVTGE